MIAYEIQPQYVIRDKIQSEKKFSPRQNLRIFWTIFFLLGKKFYWKKFCWKKNSWILPGTEFCLGFPVCFFELYKSMLIITQRYVHTAKTM